MSVNNYISLITVPRLILLVTVFALYIFNYKKYTWGFLVFALSAFLWTAWNIYIAEYEQAARTGISGCISVITYFNWTRNTNQPQVEREMKDIVITSDILHYHRACKEVLEWFAKHNLDGKNISEIIKHFVIYHNTIKNVKKEKYKDAFFCSGYDWALWLMKRILSDDEMQYVEYMAKKTIKYKIATYLGYQFYDDKAKLILIRTYIKILESRECLVTHDSLSQKLIRWENEGYAE